ncbi:putative aspartic proteinase GIP2 [Capsicum galapagoense]
MVTFKLPSSMLLLFLLLNNIFLCSAEVLYIPVTKDATSLQYITEVGQRTPLVPIKLLVHHGGGSLWVDCDKGYISSTYKPAVCNSTLCSYSKFQFCGDCKFKTQLQPGCNNNTCYIWGDNPLINTYYDRAEVAEYVLAIDSTPGVRVTSPRFIFTCLLDRDMMRLLENGVTGIEFHWVNSSVYNLKLARKRFNQLLNQIYMYYVFLHLCHKISSSRPQNLHCFLFSPLKSSHKYKINFADENRELR